MPHPEEYDVVVLGSGAPGKLIAWTLASRGQRVAVVERRYVGGSCPNIACLPSKNIIHGAKVGELFPPGSRVRDFRRGLEGRHGRRPRTQAEDGGRAGRDAPREIPRERRGARHGERAIRGAQNHRGHAELRGHADAPRPDGRHQHRVAGPARRHPRPFGVRPR